MEIFDLNNSLVYPFIAPPATISMKSDEGMRVLGIQIVEGEP
jgi:hypothetical protein